LLLYVINVLYDGLAKLNIVKNDIKIIQDAEYISSLGEVTHTNNTLEIHQKLLNVVERFDKYCVSYSDIMDVLKKMLLNIHNQWIIDKYRETFYKYICTDRTEIATLISRNLLVVNELAISG